MRASRGLLLSKQFQSLRRTSTSTTTTGLSYSFRESSSSHRRLVVPAATARSRLAVRTKDGDDDTDADTPAAWSRRGNNNNNNNNNKRHNTNKNDVWWVATHKRQLPARTPSPTAPKEERQHQQHDVSLSSSKSSNRISSLGATTTRQKTRPQMDRLPHDDGFLPKTNDVEDHSDSGDIDSTWSSTAVPLPALPSLRHDEETRRLIDLLDELAHWGYPAQGTLGRCRRALERLLEEIDPTIPGRADRALVLIHKMQRLETARYQFGSAPHLNEWPLPDQRCYETVLRILAETVSENRRLPDHCRDLVLHMHQRSTRKNSHDDNDDNNDSWDAIRNPSYQPPPLSTLPWHWNTVLLAWSKCADRHRAQYAAETFDTMVRLEKVDAHSPILFLLVCKAPPPTTARSQKTERARARVAARWWNRYIGGASTNTTEDSNNNNNNNRYLQRNRNYTPEILPHLQQPNPVEDDDDDDDELEEEDSVAESSSSAAFPSVEHASTSGDDRDEPVFVSLLDVWNPTSHFYHHFLQAIRGLPLGPRRTHLFEACFDAACRRGKVNAPVLSEFLFHLHAPDVLQQRLGPYLERAVGLFAPCVATLVQILPAEWTAHADVPKKERNR